MLLSRTPGKRRGQHGNGCGDGDYIDLHMTNADTTCVTTPAEGPLVMHGRLQKKDKTGSLTLR
ncbi:unnamed protein product [Ectocarpus sp. 8 AP-2014]